MASNYDRTAIKSDPNETDMDDDDGDPLVREMDVYISPELSQQLYLMQFPLHHKNVPLPSKARIKPKHLMIELDHELPQNIGMEGNFYLQTRTHTSQTVPITTHMALGKIARDAVYLIPLQQITQMRPTFDHVNQEDTNKSSTESTETALKSEKKPLLFKKKESERAAIARKSSYAYKKTSEDGEEWMELEVQGPASSQRKQVELAVECQSRENLVDTAAQGGPASFVKSLDYLPASSAVDLEAATTATSNPLVPVVKKLTKMLHRGVPVTYSAIRPHFPETIDDVDLLTALASCANMIRGNWVLQSRLLSYRRETRKLRNLVLYLFQTRGCIERIGIERIYEEDPAVSSEHIEMILQQVGLPGWKPRLVDNPQFCNSFPEQSQLHNQYWERLGNTFKEELQIYDEAIQEEHTFSA